MAACFITLPLVFDYVQRLQANVRSEVDFCKTETLNLWKELLEMGGSMPSSADNNVLLRHIRQAEGGDAAAKGGEAPAKGGEAPPPPPAASQPQVAASSDGQCCTCQQGPPGALLIPTQSLIAFRSCGSTWPRRQSRWSRH